MTASDDAETQAVVDGFLKQADIARQRQAWDDLLRIFQVALKQVPDHRLLRHGLAAAYLTKADRVNLKPFYLHAMEEYWRLVNGDPTDAKAHEGLMTAAVKADQLDEVMEEYRARIGRGHEAESYRQAFKKIQTLYLLKAEPQRSSESSEGGIFRTVFVRILPVVSVICLIAWVLARGKVGRHPEEWPRLSVVAGVLIKVSLFCFHLCLGYFAFQLFKSKKS